MTEAMGDHMSVECGLCGGTGDQPVITYDDWHGMDISLCRWCWGTACGKCGRGLDPDDPNPLYGHSARQRVRVCSPCKRKSNKKENYRNDATLSL